MMKAEAGRIGGLRRKETQSPKRLTAIGKAGAAVRWKGHKPKRKRQPKRRSGDWTWYQTSTGYDPMHLVATFDAVIDVTLRIPPLLPDRYDDPLRATEQFLERKAVRDAKRVRAAVRRIM